MSESISTSSSVRDFDGTVDRAVHWLLLEGNRLVIAGGIVVVAAGWILGLAYADLVAVGPDSTVGTAFASGLISGTLTMVTVALSINQLILSRVFGSPGELRDELDGTRALRRRVQRRAGEPSAPNDPADFLSLVAVTIRERARRLGSALEDSEWTPPSSVTDYVEGIEAYGENVDSAVEREAAIVDILGVVLGTEYARNLTATEHLHNEYDTHLSDAADAELEAIEDLLEVIAITRQFFKTPTLQHDFARLSRVVAYSGLLALLASLTVALVYRTNTVTVAPEHLPLLVGLGVAGIAVPLAMFLSYILCAATIARRTVSVGPFVPPENRPEDG
jgi:hypothetical protein